MVRKPVVAGQFYGGTVTQCSDELESCLKSADLSGSLPDKIVGGIVPHAGWIFSGKLAAMVFKAVMAANGDVDTFVLLGAAHRFWGTEAAVYDKGSWTSPLGEIKVDEDLAAKIIEGSCAQSNPQAHNGEHSIEVQIPFIQTLFPNAGMVPIIVPGQDDATSLGQDIGKIVSKQNEKKIVCIASTDLTHYGPRYGFAPKGVGAESLEWAKQVNDMKVINDALKMDSKQFQRHAIEDSSACGPGAVCAVIAAAKQLGADKGILLAHTTSNEVMIEAFGQQSDESVGYAAVVF